MRLRTGSLAQAACVAYGLSETPPQGGPGVLSGSDSTCGNVLRFKRPGGTFLVTAGPFAFCVIELGVVAGGAPMPILHAGCFRFCRAALDAGMLNAGSMKCFTPSA
jgi:hypothetical protein